MLVIADATLADGRRVDVRVDPEAGTIDAVGPQLAGDDRLDATGRLLLPGMVDTHVHFREPGFSHKETWTTGSRSAAAGGVTTVVDQPNTDPPTVTGAAFDETAVFRRAAGGIAFLLFVLRDPGRRTAVLVPAFYPQLGDDAAALAEHARAAGVVHLLVRPLERDRAVTFAIDDPSLVFPADWG